MNFVKINLTINLDKDTVSEISKKAVFAGITLKKLVEDFFSDIVCKDENPRKILIDKWLEQKKIQEK